jgi:AraC family transcriptional activator of mtrCDE
VLRSNVEGEPDTGLICGRLVFEQAQDNLVLAALPAVVVLRADEGPDALRVQELVMTTQAELEEDRLGAASIASALASSLLTIVLRAHFERSGAEHGVLSLLVGRQTARALGAMLEDLSQPWTLDELAARANCSRATLVRMFRRAVGAPRWPILPICV